jgi:hypothetical protein
VPAEPRRRSTDGSLGWLRRNKLAIVFAVLLALTWFLTTSKVDSNSKRLDRQARALAVKERVDNVVQRQTTYRVCARNSVDRAFAHDAVYRSGGLPALRHIEDVLPILACKPNLHGQPARALPRREQRLFVRDWRTGRLSLGEQGICSVPPSKPFC